jgi:hypothetical protein
MPVLGTGPRLGPYYRYHTANTNMRRKENRGTWNPFFKEDYLGDDFLHEMLIENHLTKTSQCPQKTSQTFKIKS